MKTNLYWDEFAEALITRMIKPSNGDAFLILANTSTNQELAQSCHAAGLRAGADTQLMIYERIPWGEEAHFGPIILRCSPDGQHIGIPVSFSSVLLRKGEHRTRLPCSKIWEKRGRIPSLLYLNSCRINSSSMKLAFTT